MTPEPPTFDLEDWLVSVLIDACDVYADAGELIDQMRAERAAETTEEVETLAREIVTAGLDRGWLDLVELTFTVSPDGTRELTDGRTLSDPEARAAIAAPCMWDRAFRSTTLYISLSSTPAGIAHLDGLETEYE
mgnify:FL=1